MNHYQIYSPDIPDFLKAASRSPEMLRLQDIGMNCGCEYTSFPRFQGLKPYSRWDHSLGVALIVWKFTADPAQALAGLFHDIATPVFAHVVDFLRGDYLTQEATEDGTRSVIEQSASLCGLLGKLGLHVDDVCDYHRYPIADNDTPRLSADRLEYTLGNTLNYAIRDEAAVRRFYNDITVGRNEDGVPELMFRSPDVAFDFAQAAMDCSEIYVADEDRYAMQILSELLAFALEKHVITENDLYTTETAVIQKQLQHPETAQAWNRFRAMARMERAEKPLGDSWRQIFAKKRYIDPCVLNLGRVSARASEYQERVHAFLQRDQRVWLSGQT